MSLSEKLIVNAALTGMVPTKADNPHVPITPEEIVADARRCRDAGASIVHVHARDLSGEPTPRKDVFDAIVGGIRAACPDLLISGTTSGRAHPEFEQRSAVLDCRPDFGSLTLGSMNFPRQASVNPPAMIRALAEAMNGRGIVPEWELFDLGMADYAHYLIRQGVLRRPYYCNILLGSLGTLAATPDNLAVVVRALPPGTMWSAAGIGRFQFFVNSLAITMGGHVRVGLEDNLFYDAGKTEPATNAGLIDRVVKVADAAGRAVASPDEARAMLGLAGRGEGVSLVAGSGGEGVVRARQ